MNELVLFDHPVAVWGLLLGLVLVLVRWPVPTLAISVGLFLGTAVAPWAFWIAAGVGVLVPWLRRTRREGVRLPWWLRRF